MPHVAQVPAPLYRLTACAAVLPHRMYCCTAMYCLQAKSWLEDAYERHGVLRDGHLTAARAVSVADILQEGGSVLYFCDTHNCDCVYCTSLTLFLVCSYVPCHDTTYLARSLPRSWFCM